MPLPLQPPLPDTRTARSAILGALRGGDPAPRLPVPDLAPYLNGPFGRGSQGERPDPATLIEPFTTAARAWRAEVVPATPADWPQAVRDALARHGARRVAIGAVCPLSPDLDTALAGCDVRRFDTAIDIWKAELFDTIDAGITAVAGGIADTGTLLLRPGPAEPRTLSLVPPLHVAVLMASTLYASLPAAMAALAAPEALPTNLLLVTGPSKTSDIQQTLAYGAHGPKALVVVLVDDVNPTQGTGR